MFRNIFIASVATRGLLRTCLPSNIALDLIRSRRGLKWGVPAMLISGVYFAIAYWCTVSIDNGGPGWLHLVVLICIWSAFKFLIMGPVSLVLLAYARGVEGVQRRRKERGAAEDAAAREHAPVATNSQTDGSHA